MSDIDADLKALLKDIGEKTGAEVRLAPSDEEETAFTVEYRGKRFPVWISGMGAAADREARLIGYLVAAQAGAAPDRKEELKSVLLGEGGEKGAFRFLTKYNHADGACFAVELVPERRLFEAAQHIERCLDPGDMCAVMDNSRIAVVRFFGEGQPFEFGQFLAQSMYEEMGTRAKVGVGSEVQSFSRIAFSYEQASTVNRITGILRTRGEVHSYREYLLVHLLNELPKSRLAGYFDQFHIEDAAELFDDEDITSVAEEFLETGLNLAETSRNLFMHRNTLTYRIEKIERMTGLNIRKFPDAVTYRVLTVLYRLMQL